MKQQGLRVWWAVVNMAMSPWSLLRGRDRRLVPGALGAANCPVPTAQHVPTQLVFLLCGAASCFNRLCLVLSSAPFCFCFTFQEQ
jgi:hypothetical protein